MFPCPQLQIHDFTFPLWERVRNAVVFQNHAFRALKNRDNLFPPPRYHKYHCSIYFQISIIAYNSILKTEGVPHPRFQTSVTLIFVWFCIKRDRHSVNQSIFFYNLTSTSTKIIKSFIRVQYNFSLLPLYVIRNFRLQ